MVAVMIEVMVVVVIIETTEDTEVEEMIEIIDQEIMIDTIVVGVGKSAATEVRHWIGFAPDDIVQHPVIQVLQQGANPIDIVITTNDPECTVVF